MSGKIFVLRNGESLEVLLQTPYENEDLIQSLIENHPEILAGDLIDPKEPREWVFVTREMAVPLDDGIGRLDHFYVDQNAVPILIEVKRRSDTRIRREVVGQLLDYAASGIQFWTIGQIRDEYEKNIGKSGAGSLADIGIEDEEKFWQDVEANLRIGKIRLLFIADEIPMSLQAIIEFLNNQMDKTEVYGIEIKQFDDKDGLKAYVPNVVGRTASDRIKGDAKRSYANHDEFLESVGNQRAKELYMKLFDYAEKNNHKISLSKAGFSLSVIDPVGKSHAMLFGFGNDADRDKRKNSIETTFGMLKEMDTDLLEHYKKKIYELNLFEQTPGGKTSNWRLNNESTDEEMQMLIDIIKDIHSKIC